MADDLNMFNKELIHKFPSTAQETLLGMVRATLTDASQIVANIWFAMHKSCKHLQYEERSTGSRWACYYSGVPAEDENSPCTHTVCPLLYNK